MCSRVPVGTAKQANIEFEIKIMPADGHQSCQLEHAGSPFFGSFSDKSPLARVKVSGIPGPNAQWRVEKLIAEDLRELPQPRLKCRGNFPINTGVDVQAVLSASHKEWHKCRRGIICRQPLLCWLRTRPDRASLVITCVMFSDSELPAP